MTDISVSTWYNYPKVAFPDAPELGGTPHAEKAMKQLGITYKYATAHAIFDEWRFYDCENVPDELPRWAKRMKP